jgi:hypothetical protein
MLQACICLLGLMNHLHMQSRRRQVQGNMMIARRIWAAITKGRAGDRLATPPASVCAFQKAAPTLTGTATSLYTACAKADAPLRLLLPLLALRSDPAVSPAAPWSPAPKLLAGWTMIRRDLFDALVYVIITTNIAHMHMLCGTYQWMLIYVVTN